METTVLFTSFCSSIDECVGKFRGSSTYSHFSNFNNKDDCVTAGEEWLEFHQGLEVMAEATTEAACNSLKTKYPKHEFIWGRPINLNGDVSKKCLAKMAAPDCAEYPFGRENHLSNNGAGIEEIGYDMPLTNFLSGKNKRCVLRTRYWKCFTITAHRFHSTITGVIYLMKSTSKLRFHDIIQGRI